MRTRVGFLFMNYTKPPLTIAEQINLLKERGLQIVDVAQAESYLSNISYYRLSAYMFPFLSDTSNHVYRAGASFDEIINNYLFDRELRLLVFDAIEKIEISFRSQMIYHYSINYGADWLENSALYSNEEYYREILAKLDAEISRSHEIFIKHYKNTYTTPPRPPAWMSIEITSFGLLSLLYKNLRMTKEKKAIAKHFGLHPYVLESWLQTISYVRNIVAHHSRLWNRVMVIQPQMPNHTAYNWLSEISTKDKNFIPTKIYAVLSCILYLLKTINSQTNFAVELKKLIEKYPKSSLKNMGFPTHWKMDGIWV
jgi:abortive infection bacteriophage resistance protein